MHIMVLVKSSERILYIEIENQISDYRKIWLCVLQGSFLESLMIIVYANNIPQTIKSSIFSYADDSCLMYEHKDVKETKKKSKHRLSKCSCTGSVTKN